MGVFTSDIERGSELFLEQTAQGKLYCFSTPLAYEMDRGSWWRSKWVPVKRDVVDCTADADEWVGEHQCVDKKKCRNMVNGPRRAFSAADYKAYSNSYSQEHEQLYVFLALQEQLQELHDARKA